MIKKLATVHQNHISARLSSLKSHDFKDDAHGGSNCGQWLEKLNLKPLIFASLIACTYPVIPSEKDFFPDALQATSSLLESNISSEICYLEQLDKLSPKDTKAFFQEFFQDYAAGKITRETKNDVLNSFSKGILAFFPEADQEGIILDSCAHIQTLKTLEQEDVLHFMTQKNFFTTNSQVILSLMAILNENLYKTHKFETFFPESTHLYNWAMTAILKEIVLSKTQLGAKLSFFDAWTYFLSRTITIGAAADEILKIADDISFNKEIRLRAKGKGLLGKLITAMCEYDYYMAVSICSEMNKDKDIDVNDRLEAVREIKNINGGGLWETTESLIAKMFESIAKDRNVNLQVRSDALDELASMGDSNSIQAQKIRLEMNIPDFNFMTKKRLGKYLSSDSPFEQLETLSPKDTGTFSQDCVEAQITRDIQKTFIESFSKGIITFFPEPDQEGIIKDIIPFITQKNAFKTHTQIILSLMAIVDDSLYKMYGLEALFPQDASTYYYLQIIPLLKSIAICEIKEIDLNKKLRFFDAWIYFLSRVVSHHGPLEKEMNKIYHNTSLDNRIRSRARCHAYFKKAENFKKKYDETKKSFYLEDAITYYSYIVQNKIIDGNDRLKAARGFRTCYAPWELIPARAFHIIIDDHDIPVEIRSQAKQELKSFNTLYPTQVINIVTPQVP